ncbi:competence type IV pilus minor pilin ComGF [Indiicoccus explosivorum]|uniref:competence type IV pilus minor pilin ComGF n=1 Tax=Indiicoccus explosivorum TaxID=1917864 RepID=UPI000B446645|nr:competence type IV pilus minor pilin ComGF [Indiicoccus explosivorum]
MRKLRIGILGEERGMTYISALFGLLIFLAIAPLFALFFRSGSEFVEDVNPKHAEWELFTYELRSYLQNSGGVSVINNGRGIRMTDSKGDLSVELYSPVIRKQRAGQGHEIMLTGLKTVNFALSGNKITIAAEFTSGIQKEETYAVPPVSQ